MEQLALFDKPSLNTVARLKEAMRESVRQCRLSRDEIADELSRIMKIEGLRPSGNARCVSKATLDKWLGSENYIIPLSLLPLFCSITQSHLPIKALAAPLGLEIIDEEGGRLLKWAQAERRRREASKQAKRLAEEAGI